MTLIVPPAYYGPPPGTKCYLCHHAIKDANNARGVESPASFKLWAHESCITSVPWWELVQKYHDAVQQILMHEHGGIV